MSFSLAWESEILKQPVLQTDSQKVDAIGKYEDSLGKKSFFEGLFRRE